jgi:hypothetical protein
MSVGFEALTENAIFAKEPEEETATLIVLVLLKFKLALAIDRELFA